MKDTWKLGVGHTQQVAASQPGSMMRTRPQLTSAQPDYPERLESTLTFTRAAPPSG